MASGRFLDPVVLSRTAPLITSFASLSYCWAQNVFISIFTMPRNREKSNALLQPYIEDWMVLWIHGSADCNLYNNHFDSKCKPLLSPPSPCCVELSDVVCCWSNLQCCTLCIRTCGCLEVHNHHQQRNKGKQRQSARWVASGPSFSILHGGLAQLRLHSHRSLEICEQLSGTLLNTKAVFC
jgi:hypothetical protein